MINSDLFSLNSMYCNKMIHHWLGDEAFNSIIVDAHPLIISGTDLVGDLSRTPEINTNSKIFFCEECEKIFATQKALDRHKSKYSHGTNREQLNRIQTSS